MIKNKGNKKAKERCPLKRGAFSFTKKHFPSIVLIILGAVVIFLTTIKFNKKETKGRNSIQSITETESVKTLEEEVVVCEAERIMKSYEEIAYEIIRGDYGVGEARKAAILSLGYDEIAYIEIQKIVDAILSQEASRNTISTKTQNIQTPVEEISTTEVASIVWNCMKKYGWNDIMCAGIMGNMMAEVGGQTFNLDYNSSGGCGYGLCQWTGGRRNLLLSLYGSKPTIDQQVEFMYKELLGDGVPRQVSEEVYQKLLNSSTPEECALLFAHKFERCGAAFNARQNNARKALEAFS